MSDLPADERPSAALAISNAMTRLHREHVGRGPRSVRTVIGQDHVICFLEDLFTPMEHTLLRRGERDAVFASRHAFQRALEPEFVAMVESAVGRKVRSFLSQSSFDPDISVEVFVLEPNGGSSIERGGKTGEMQIDPGDILRDAQQLVERGWTQHADSRNAEGDEVEPWAPTARSWSLLGAIVAAAEQFAHRHRRDLPLEQLAEALHHLAKVVDDDSLAAWNDVASRAQQEVVETLAAAGRSASQHAPPQESG